MAETETKESNTELGSQGVQLGIGTLIVIAVIVTMCSGRGEMEEIQKDTAQLKQQLGVIEKKLDALTLQGGATDATISQESPATPPAAVEAEPGNGSSQTTEAR